MINAFVLAYGMNVVIAFLSLLNVIEAEFMISGTHIWMKKGKKMIYDGVCMKVRKYILSVMKFYRNRKYAVYKAMSSCYHANETGYIRV